jgi:hypothetical protein
MGKDKKDIIIANLEHYKQLRDSDYLGSYDIPKGKEVPVTIAKVTMETMFNRQKNEEDTKPVLFFEGTKKGLILNVTNMEAVASFHGNVPAGWTGKQVTLYRGTTRVGRDTVDCLRIKNKGKNSQAQEATKSIIK